MDVRRRLLEQYRWTTEPAGWGGASISDMSRWWRDGDLLRAIADALAELHSDAQPTVVAGIQSRGYLLGGLVAVTLGVGFVEIEKDLHHEQVAEPVITSTTPADYNDRNLTLGTRRKLMRPKDRVLLVDDWIETGAQATAARTLVEKAEAEWVGVAVIVDALSGAGRRRLNVRGLVRERELGW